MCASSASAQAAGAEEVRAFGALGLAIKVGAEGVGYDAATPVSRTLNLRAGASFFSYTRPLTEDGLQIDPTVNFRKVGFSVDYYPRHGTFRLSPGLVVHNGNHAHAAVMVPAGGSFDLGESTYTSAASDPLHGTADLQFGHTVAPSLTLGWGNPVPRDGRRWSVPFEAGFEYIGRPTLTYGFAGSACDAEGCGQVQNDPEFQADRVAEEAKLNRDLAPLRFYPIVALGVGYRF